MGDLTPLGQHWHAANPCSLLRGLGWRCPCAVVEGRADEKPVHSGQWTAAGIWRDRPHIPTTGRGQKDASKGEGLIRDDGDDADADDDGDTASLEHHAKPPKRKTILAFQSASFKLFSPCSFPLPYYALRLAPNIPGPLRPLPSLNFVRLYRINH